MKHTNPCKNKLLGALCLVTLLSIPSVSYAQLDIWTPVGPGIAAGDTMFSIAVDPNFSDTVYVGSSSSVLKEHLAEEQFGLLLLHFPET